VTPAHIYNMIAHDMYMARTYHIAIPDNLDERVVEAVERDPSIESKSHFVRIALREKLASMNLVMVLMALVGGATIADLTADLARVEGLDNYPLAELKALVGVAWGYDVGYDGVVWLADGTFDLAGVAV